MSSSSTVSPAAVPPAATKARDAVSGSDTLVVHDYFGIRGGGERLALELVESLEADLMTGYRLPSSYPASMFPPDVADLNLPGFLRRQGFRVLALSAAFSGRRAKAATYGTRVFSGICAPFAAPSRTADGRSIYYCHTPPRFLYDQKAYFASQSSALRRLGLATMGTVFRKGYEDAVDRMHTIVANSENIRRRIKTYLGKESEVIFPPCDVERFAWGEPQGYYLSTARLSGLKRVEMIVDAFIRMPARRLVVASGGEDEQKLRAKAAGSGNISFTGWVDDAALHALMAGAIATIYLPIDEDFGMSPVESMAAGKPVIGVAEGGLLETVLDGETGLLLSPGFAVDSIVDAVEAMTPARAIAMRSACTARASLFSRERFLIGMRSVIDRTRP